MVVKDRKKCKFMFHAMEGTGHLNACLGFAQSLEKNGHEIVFAINESLAKNVEKFGFRALKLKQAAKVDQGKDKFAYSENPAKDLAKVYEEWGFFTNKSSFEKMNLFQDKQQQFIDGLAKLNVTFNPQIEKFLEDEKPDAFIQDHIMVPLAVAKSKIPSVLIASAAPLRYYKSELLPPCHSGYPVDDKSQWKLFHDTHTENMKRFVERQIKAYEDSGYTDEALQLINAVWYSEHLNVYQYPLELDYDNVNGFKIPSHYVGVDAFVRKDPGHFEFPKEFLARKTGSDKKIYLSMGSMGSYDIDLMQKILGILSKLPYKVIVSKGPRGDEYELPENCWGENYLPQPEIVELVDLVITHGGNNTFTETFAAGKKMIVMPMFSDQFDNAQRLHETGYGIRIEPYDFTEEELTNAVEKLMNDEELSRKLESAKMRIAESNRKDLACQRVVEMVEKYSSSK